MNDKNRPFEEAYEGKLEEVKKRIAEDGNIVRAKDSNGRLLLHWAALGGHTQLVKILLNLNPESKDSPDDIQATPLILASTAGRLPVVRKLLEVGVNVNLTNQEGHSALQYACSKGWSEVAELLLRNGANVNIPDRRGARPLHRAASLGLLNVVQLLLAQQDIDINARDSYGNTPLHLSCEENRVEVAQSLVRRGAKLDSVNKDSQTPLDLADINLRRILTEIASNL